MRTWIRARLKLPCGNCRREIAAGVVCLELSVGTTKRLRCQTCGESMFGEKAPDVIEAEPAITGPQPTLGLTLSRGPDFVTPGQVARSSRFNNMRDAKMRQTGEEG